MNQSPGDLSGNQSCKLVAIYADYQNLWKTS